MAGQADPEAVIVRVRETVEINVASYPAGGESVSVVVTVDVRNAVVVVRIVVRTVLYVRPLLWTLCSYMTYLFAWLSSSTRRCL